MSTPWKQDEYRQIEQELLREDEILALQKQFLEPEEVKESRALTTAERVLGLTSPRNSITDPYSMVSPVNGFQEDQIERVGCWLIDSHFILLDWLQVPEKLRPLVVVIAGLSGGNWRDYTPITQKQIASRLGIGTDTVRERIRELVDWGQNSRPKRVLIYIQQKEREQGGKKYQTTEYMPIVIKYAADFIRRLKAKGLQPVNRHKAITENTVELYNETAKEVAHEMGEREATNILNPRKAKNVTPKQQRISFIEDRRERWLRAQDEYEKALLTSGYDLDESWREASLQSEERWFAQKPQ